MTEYFECPNCKTMNLTSYLLNPLLKIGMYKCGDYVCLECKKVYRKEGQEVIKE